MFDQLKVVAGKWLIPIYERRQRCVRLSTMKHLFRKCLVKQRCQTSGSHTQTSENFEQCCFLFYTVTVESG